MCTYETPFNNKKMNISIIDALICEMLHCLVFATPHILHYSYMLCCHFWYLITYLSLWPCFLDYSRVCYLLYKKRVFEIELFNSFSLD